MKKILLALGLAVSVALPALAQAREVTFTTELLDYGGDGAYMALYLTDASGAYQGTLWVAGKKSKYYKHLSGWARGSRLAPVSPSYSAGSSLLPRAQPLRCV